MRKSIDHDNLLRTVRRIEPETKLLLRRRLQGRRGGTPQP